MPTYNHQIAFALTVRSSTPTGRDITSDMLRHAIESRISDLDSLGDIAWHEACLPPLDTFEECAPEPPFVRDYNIRRNDGRTVSFRGNVLCHVGKAKIYRTIGGHLIFQYAPYGNNVSLVVIPLSNDMDECECIMKEHCSGDELDRVLRAIGGETIRIP